jgi:WD40 repeat protein
VGHTDRVKAVDFSPDGRYVLTGAADSVVRLWDLQTGEEIRQLSGDMQDVNSAVFSPDSQFILTGSRFDHTVRLWDVETGEEIRRFSEGNAGTFSLDGQMIFVFSEDNRDSAMIDLNSGEVLHTIPAPQQYRRPENTGYSPDGRLFVDVPEDEGSLHIREVGSGDEILRVPVSLDAFDTFTFSPDNRYFAVTNDNDTDFDVIQVWELATGELAQTLENESRPMALAFSPDSRLIASGGYGPDVRVWDVQTGEMVRDLRAHHALGTRKIAFSPDARYLMSGGFDRRALLWDLAAGGGVPELVEKAYREAPPLAMSPDGSLLAGNAPEGPLVVWDAATGEHRGQFQADQIPVWQVAFTWDNALLLTMSDRMRTWDVRQGALLHEFDPALTEDRGISATRTLGTLAVSPQYVLAAHEGNDEWTGGAIAWDARTGEEVRRFTAPMGAQTIFVSPDAKLLATYNIADHQARIFDIATGQEIHVFPVENSSAGALAFSPDSRVLFTGGDVVSALWDLNTGEQLHEIVGPREVVGDAAFSHDGSYVVTGSADNTVQIWDTLTGRELRRVTEPPDYGVFGLSQDDQYWFMASDDRLYILDTHIEDAVNRLCARLLRDFTAEEREQYQIPDEEPTCPAEP